jgi:hypothetical protein
MNRIALCSPMATRCARRILMNVQGQVGFHHLTFMDRLMKSRLARMHHLPFTVLFALAASVFVSTVAIHVYALDFAPLGAFCLPVLAVYFTFTSLLYVRGNSVHNRKSKLRTLYAAEVSMQATVWYLVGIVSGSSLYGVFRLVDFQMEAPSSHWHCLWLLSFALPCALMLRGMFALMRAACIVAPQMFRASSRYDMWRRIDQRISAHAVAC